MNLRLFALALVLFCGTESAWSQAKTEPLTWEDLQEVRFETSFDENASETFEKPTFGESIASREGDWVEITGYVIPFDVQLNYYVVSAFPFAACFFWGGAGPESVVDLELSDDQHFVNDQRVTFCGKLDLNRNDFFALPYRLQ